MDLEKNRVFDNKEAFFNEAFELYFERVATYVFSFCRDREMAKNIAQDCFVAFWENIDRVEMSKTPLPYLLFVARNLALNHLKHNMVKRRHEEYYVWREEQLRHTALGNCASDIFAGKEVEKLLARSMEQMKPKVRETFHLSRFRQMTNIQVADHLGISVKTVEYRIAAALRIVKKNLRDFIPIVVLALLYLLNHE